MEIFGNEQTDNSRALPEDLTLEKIEDCENTDWLTYVTYYTTYDTSIIEKGRECFAAALALAKTEEETTHINVSSLQVDYMEAYFNVELYTPRRAKNKVMVLLNNFFNQKATDVPEETKNAMVGNVLSVIAQQAEERVVYYNQVFCDNALSYGVTIYKEGRPGLGSFTPNLKNYPQYWNETSVWKN